LSKGIKVDNQVYDDLDKLRGKGDTFSQVIEVLLESRLSTLNLMLSLEGALKFQDWKRDKLNEALGFREEDHVG